MKPTTLYGFIILITALALMTGCSPKTSPATMGEIFISLVDSPASINAVNIQIMGISIHSLGADSLSGWISIKNSQTTYNLLTLRNGMNAILCDTILPPGTFDKIMLLIGNNSNIVVDGISDTLDISDANAIIINHQVDMEAGGFIGLTIDFDANRSVVPVSENRYKLEPVIRVVTNSGAGTISGIVQPAAAKATVVTTVGTDTVTAYCDSVSGHFVLVALPVGTYLATIMPGDTTYRDTTFSIIPVTAQHDSNLGTITLSPR